MDSVAEPVPTVQLSKALVIASVSWKTVPGVRNAKTDGVKSKFITDPLTAFSDLSKNLDLTPPLPLVDELVVSIGGVDPAPGVGKGVELRLTYLTGRFAEEDIVVRVGIKCWIEIDEIDALVRKFVAIAQPAEVIAEVETVH